VPSPTVDGRLVAVIHCANGAVPSALFEFGPLWLRLLQVAECFDQDVLGSE
jgi:hypothetical protein